MSNQRTGSCLCGKVTVSLTGEPVSRVLCHCNSCKKSSGVIFGSNFFMARKDVNVTDSDGVLRGYQDSSCDNGGTVLRSFCSFCGSNVHTQNLTNPDIKPFIIIPMGILDEQEETRPASEFYVKRRADWYNGVGGSNEYQGMT